MNTTVASTPHRFMIDWSIFIREMPGWETEWKRLNGELPPVSQSAPEQATWEVIFVSEFVLLIRWPRFKLVFSIEITKQGRSGLRPCMRVLTIAVSRANR